MLFKHKLCSCRRGGTAPALEQFWWECNQHSYKPRSDPRAVNSMSQPSPGDRKAVQNDTSVTSLSYWSFPSLLQLCWAAVTQVRWNLVTCIDIWSQFVVFSTSMQELLPSAKYSAGHQMPLSKILSRSHVSSDYSSSASSSFFFSFSSLVFEAALLAAAVQLMTLLPEPSREPKEQDRDSSKGCFSNRNKNLRSSWNILFGNTFCIDWMMPHLHIQHIIYISNTFVYSIPFLHFQVVKYLISLFSWQIGSSFTK